MKDRKQHKISQSFVKDYNDYKGKALCGLQLHAKYFGGGFNFEPTEPMKLGNLFEYYATGGMPRDGVVPVPKVVYAGTKRESIATAYQRAIDSSELFKQIKKEIGLEIEEVGLKIETKNKNGILDIWGNINGRPCIVDLKYSGLIDDKWSETGWDSESLHYKERLLIQAVQYKMLVHEKMGLAYEDFDFFFMVFSSKEVNNVKFFRINIDEDNFEIHEKHINTITSQLSSMDLEKDLIPYPTVKGCMKCPLLDNCDHKTETPLIEDIYY